MRIFNKHMNESFSPSLPLSAEPTEYPHWRATAAERHSHGDEEVHWGGERESSVCLQARRATNGLSEQSP